MKEKILTIMFSLFCLTAAGQNNQNSTLLGDANGDGIISKADVEVVVKHIMGDKSVDIIIENANVNHDKDVNVADLVGLIEILHSASVPTKRIFSAYVNLDWDDITLDVCNPDNGYFKLTYKNNDPCLNRGNVTIINNGDVQYIILITGVQKEGKSYILEACLGSLGYIFYDTEFTLSTDNEDLNDSNLKNLFFEDSQSSSRTRSLSDGQSVEDGKIRKTGTLWKNNDQERTDYIYDGGDVKAYSKSKFGLNLDYVATLKFGERSEEEINGVKFYCAKDFTIDICLKGNVDAYYDFYIDVTKDEDFDLAPNEECKYVLLKHKIFPNIPLKFAVGPVPICIDLGTDLFADVSLNGSGEFHYTHGIGAKSETIIGGRYDGKKEDKFEMYHIKRPLTITPHDPTISGKVSLSGKVHVFPRVHAWLYGLAGPSIDFKPYIKADLCGGFSKDLIQDASSDFFALSLNTYGGMDVAAGLSFSRMNYEEFNKSTKDLNILERALYQSPKDIKFLSADPSSIEKDVPTTVKFEVYDKGFDDNNVLTPLPQIVKFDGKGTVVSDYGVFGIADKSIVTVNWTPTSSEDILYARLYDCDGGVIAEDLYGDEARVVETGIADNITENSATIHAFYYGNVNSCGFYVKQEDGEYNQFSVDNHANGDFHLNLEWLKPGKKYSYYAYATIGEGENEETFYGKELSFTTKDAQLQLCPDDNHPHMIDLGLPSGTKWSCCNVGASNPGETGGYYAWGEINEKNEYVIENYANYDFSHYDETQNPVYPNSGFINIGSDISGTSYDVAHALWGDSWQMPSADQCRELINKTTSSWKNQNGVNGLMFIGMNGNSVFIPAAGDKWNKDSFGIGERGSYWTSTQHGAKEAAFCFYVNPEVSTVEANTRFGGMTVRPVQPGIKIETGEATAIKTTTAKLNGTVENFEKADENIKFAFLYSKSEDIQNSSDGRTVEASCDDNGNLTADISDLTDYTTYYYAAAYKDGDADYVLGEVKSFKTTPLVTTIENPETTVVSATLRGTCSKGIYNAGFSVKKYGNAEYTQYNACPDENGNFSITIDGLDANTQYVFYAFVIANEIIYLGEEFEFVTETNPSVITLSAQNLSQHSATIYASTTGNVDKCLFEVYRLGGANELGESVIDGESFLFEGVKNEDGNYSYTLTNLISGYEYYYSAYAELNDVRYSGEELSFRTNLCPDENHPHMIDLGLPSGIKWACCNVGASSPEKNGNYYAWGETEQKSSCTWENYIYQYPNTWFINLGNDISGTSYDVAHVKWGDGWKMPSKIVFQEIVDNCIKVPLYYPNTNFTSPAYLFISANKNSILLPDAGCLYDSSPENYSGVTYWTSTQATPPATETEHKQRDAYCFRNMYNIDTLNRLSGLPVRAVWIPKD